MSSEDTYKTVIVLGRSGAGTSLTAGLIDGMGVDMGGPDDKSARNPKGYFERSDIKDRLRPLKPDRYDADWILKGVLAVTSEHKEFEKTWGEIMEDIDTSGDWGWKIQKSLFFMPIILKYVDNPHFIVANRDFEGNVKSIMKGISQHPRNIVEWSLISYYTELEHFFDENPDLPRMNVYFDRFFSEPERQVRKVCEFLDKPFSRDLIDFIDPDLRHFK